MRLRNRATTQAAIVFLLLLSISAFGKATFLTCKITRVIDGDTIEISHNGISDKVRLYGIDCPEIDQPYGELAWYRTSELALNKDVSIEEIGRDQDKRLVGVVILPGKRNLNQLLVAEGLAWWYRECAPKSTELPKLESAAQNKRIGLWADSDAVPPWSFRATKHSKQPQASSPSADMTKDEREYLDWRRTANMRFASKMTDFLLLMKDIEFTQEWIDKYKVVGIAALDAIHAAMYPGLPPKRFWSVEDTYQKAFSTQMDGIGHMTDGVANKSKSDFQEAAESFQKGYALLNQATSQLDAACK